MPSAPGHRRGAWVRAVALLTAASVLPTFGCSFVFLKRPRDDYRPDERIDCTTGYALPNLDLALALLHIASVAILASASGDSFGGDKNRQALAQGDVFWMVMNGVSSGWGYYKVGECRDLVAEDARVPERPMRFAPRPRPRPVYAPAVGQPQGGGPPATRPLLAPSDEPPAGAAPAAAPVAPPGRPAEDSPPVPRAPQKVDDE
ncbi:MAG TPA: hypothetical protein VHM31_22190 [Polyangia bacterium]|nr:hypothetical protein [Polyangia bacterium]